MGCTGSKTNAPSSKQQKPGQRRVSKRPSLQRAVTPRKGSEPRAVSPAVLPTHGTPSQGPSHPGTEPMFEIVITGPKTLEKRPEPLPKAVTDMGTPYGTPRSPDRSGLSEPMSARTGWPESMPSREIRAATAEKMGISVIELTALVFGLEGKSEAFIQKYQIRLPHQRSHAGSHLPSEITALTQSRVVAGNARRPRPVGPWGNIGGRPITTPRPNAVSPKAQFSNSPGSPAGTAGFMDETYIPPEMAEWFDGVRWGTAEDEEPPEPIEGSLDLGSGNSIKTLLENEDRVALGDDRWKNTVAYYVVGAEVIVRKGIDLLEPRVTSFYHLARLQVAHIEESRKRAKILWPGEGDFPHQGWVSTVAQSGQVLIAREGEEVLTAAREKAREKMDAEWLAWKQKQ